MVRHEVTHIAQLTGKSGASKEEFRGLEKKKQDKVGANKQKTRHDVAAGEGLLVVLVKLGEDLCKTNAPP